MIIGFEKSFQTRQAANLVLCCTSEIYQLIEMAPQLRQEQAFPIMCVGWAERMDL